MRRQPNSSTLLAICLFSLSFSQLDHARGSQEGVARTRSSESNSKDLPLEATRNLEFATEEGTWISLDVSPDGSTIIMELLGDLYTVAVVGGKAARITSGMAFDSQPTYAPNGQWIAFISDRDGAENLWISRPDGSEPRKISRERSREILSPAWSPDSQYLVVSRREPNRSYGFWVYHVDGGSGVGLASSEGESDEEADHTGSRFQRKGAVFSPDGRYLFFARRQAASVYNQMSFGWQIYRRDMLSGDVDQITQAQGGAFRPLLSPDGKKMVYGTRFETRTGLRIRDLESGQDSWLRYPIQRDDMESLATRDLLPRYAFTPDGRSLILSYDGRIHRLTLPSGDSEPIPFSADVALDLGPLLNFQRRVGTGPVRSRLIQDPVQSPDGKQLAFSAMANLYLMDLTEGVPRRVTNRQDSQFKPSWSADSKTLVYVTWGDAAGGHIWRVSVDGSQAPRQLTRVPAFYTDPNFSPDGTRIVARRGNAWMRSQTPSEFGGLKIPLDLIWLPADGGASNLIVPARGLGSPHFGPEGQRIYFHSRQGLVSMRYDGTDRRTHLKVTGRKRPTASRSPSAQDIRMHPKGGWALAKVSNQLYAVAVPSIGNTPDLNVFSPNLPVAQVTDIGADSFAWAEGGDTMTWAVGSTFFRRPFASLSFRSTSSEETSADGEDNATTTGAKESLPSEEAKERDSDVDAIDVVLEFPRHTPKGNVLLDGARIITMDREQVLEGGQILVQDNRIAGVGEKGSLEIPANTRRIDLSGKTIVPGFVDTHAHYDVRTEGVFELHNWSFLANLAYGVTTGLDVQTSTNDYLSYQDLVEAGKILGPRAYSTGPGVFNSTDFRSSKAALYVLEKYKKYYRNHNLKAYNVGNREQRQWVVQAAQELGLTVTTEGALDLKLNLTHAVDGFGGNEHALPIVPLYADVVTLFARSQIGYTPTLLVLYGGPFAENYFFETTEVHDDPKLNRFVPHNEIDRLSRRRPWFREDEHAFPKTAAQAAKIQRVGGLIGVGGHGQLQGLGYHWEMWALAMGGMTPLEVLQAATIDGAQIIGLSQDLGSIAPGKLADLVVLDSNPLENIRNTNTVRYVMKNGELFEGDSLTQVWPKRKEIPPFWWWEENPGGS